MEPTSRPAAPFDPPAPAAQGGSGGSGESAVLPVSAPLPVTASASGPSVRRWGSRHRRPTDAELAEAGPLANARFVRSTIVFTILFVIAMTALIWYRWYPVVLPTSYIMFVGTESLDGAVATISRDGRESYSVTIDEKNDRLATVWLVPGRYDLLVTRNGRVLQRTSFVVVQMQGLVDSLADKPGAHSAENKGPATTPATSSDGMPG
jgi:hypothetical protein